MRRSLASILRLRSLLEEESRVRLERAVQQASRIETARMREAEITAACKDAAAAAIMDEQGGWPTAFVDQKIAGLRGEQLELLARAMAAQIWAHHEEFVARRKERQQVETLLRNEAEQRNRELDRREQRAVDDWFGSARNKRGRD